MSLLFSFYQKSVCSFQSLNITSGQRVLALCSKISFPFQLWASHLWPHFLKSLSLRLVFLPCISVHAVFGIVFLNAGYQNENTLHLHRHSPQSPSDVFPSSPANVTSRAQSCDPLSLSLVVDGHQLCTSAAAGEAPTASEAKLWGWFLENKKKTHDPDSRLQIQTLQTESMFVASSLG